MQWIKAFGRPLAIRIRPKPTSPQAATAGRTWTILLRRRALIAGMSGGRGQSPITRTVTVTAGKTGRPTGRMQLGRAKPKSPLRRRQKNLPQRLKKAGITRTGRTCIPVHHGRGKSHTSGGKVSHVTGLTSLSFLGLFKPHAYCSILFPLLFTTTTKKDIGL